MAANSLIDITTNDVQSTIDQLRALRQNDEDVMRRIRILIMGLGDEWMGAAERAYLNAYLSTEHYVTDMHHMVGEFTDVLQKAVTDMRQIDQTLLRDVNNI